MVQEILSEQIDESISKETQASDYAQLARLLIEAIPDDRKTLFAGKVMTYLASETLRAVEAGEAVPRIPTKAIYLDLGGNQNKEPSGWLSPIWKEIEGRYYPEIEPRLIELCRRAGLAAYPVLEKDDGKPAFYRLGTKPLPPAEGETAQQAEVLTGNTVRYERDLSLQLSWMGKLFFRGELKLTPLKRYGYATWQLIFMIAAIIFETLLCLILWYRRVPVTGQDLMLLSMALLLPLGAYWHFRGFFRLFEDRIMIAPDWMLAWKEFGATVEVNRAKEPGAPAMAHVYRYSATCPICGWKIKLDRGEPDFPRRIVGRCEEHPREHVFSFDRGSKRGIRLIATYEVRDQDNA